MSVVVFLGPTLSRDEARDLLPDALYRPPATQSDIITAVESDRATAIGLIDGVFFQNLSVWHGEICYALSRGVAVFGASSMGALRAAETSRFGAVGVGVIYQWYANGELIDDDEVAVAHCESDAGFRALSHPLVNIRATLYRARKAGRISAEDVDLVIAAGRRLYFPDRTVPAIIEEALKLGLSDNSAAEVRALLSHEYVDQKAEDARVLLRMMRAHQTKPAKAGWTFADPYVFQTLYDNDRRVTHANMDISLREIVSHAAVNDPDFFDVRRAAFDRAVMLFMAALVEVELTEDDYHAELASLRLEHRLDSDQDVEAWCRANDLNDVEFVRLIRENAHCRRLRRWLMANRGLDRGTRFVLDEMRRRGIYTRWAARAAAEAAGTKAFASEIEAIAPLPDDPNVLVEEHALATGIRVQGDVRKWAEAAGFSDIEELRDALERSAAFRRVQGRILAELTSGSGGNVTNRLRTVASPQSADIREEVYDDPRAQPAHRS